MAAELVAGAVLGAIASEALARIILIVKDIKRKDKNLQKLESHLHCLKPFVEELRSTTRVRETVPAWEWVQKLEGELEAAETLILSLHNSKMKRISLARMSHRLAGINDNISDLRRDAIVAGWASTLLAIDSLAQNQAEQRKILDDTRAAQEEILDIVRRLSQAVTSQPSNLRERNIARALGASRHASKSTYAASSSAGGAQYQYRLVKSDTSNPMVDFGGDLVAEDVITNLIDKHRYTKWLGLWAMGGAGKTFTARKIFQDPRIKRYFSGGQFWITVSKDGLPSHSLLQDLFQQIQNKRDLSELPESLEVWKAAIKNLLDRDNVLLVVDDVWESQILESLDVISEERKGVILVTTRDDKILRRERAKIIEIPRLSPVHSWQLFSWYAFHDHGRSLPSGLMSIATDVAAECQGLPLALEVIGASMKDIHVYSREKKHGRNLEAEWKKALERLRGADVCGNEYDNLFGRLQSSVDNLSDVDARLKDCFFDMAAFPEDCEIEIEDLLSMWIGAGHVKADADSKVSSEDEARYLLGVLVAKSMIKLTEPGSHDKLSPFDDGSYCKVHDMMRDLARRNLKKNFKTTQIIDVHERKYLYASGLRMEAFPESWSNSRTRFSVEKLSLFRNNLLELPDVFDAPNLQVVILKQNQNLAALPPGFFRLLSNLKVLNLAETHIETISDEVVDNLKSLVLLDVRWCLRLKTISRQIESLHHLETILLEGSFHIRLFPPKSLRTLSGSFYGPELFRWHSLRSVRLEDTVDIRGISGLAGLRVFEANVLLTGNEELMQLQDLKVLKLCLHDRWSSTSTDIHDIPCLGELQQLEVLWLEIRGNKDFQFPASFAEHGAFPCLREMELNTGVAAKCFRFHPGTMPQIESLTVIRQNAPDISTTYKSLAELSSLVFLSLKVSNAQSIDDIFSEPNCFPKLESVMLHNDSWGDVCMKLPTGIGALPRVEYVEFTAKLSEDCRRGHRCNGYACPEPCCPHVKPPRILELEREGRLEVRMNFPRDFTDSEV